MPKTPPITPQELRAIRESVGWAWGKLIEDQTVIRDFKKLVRREKRLSPERRLQERMLLSLQCNQKRDLREWPINKTIAKAVEMNDLRFFIKLGRVLASKPITAETFEAPTPNRLAGFLVAHWAERKDGLPELFYLTPEGLTEVCSHSLGLTNLTRDAVVKLRQRLGLKPFKRRKIHVIREGTKLRFLQQDKTGLPKTGQNLGVDSCPRPRVAIVLKFKRCPQKGH